MKFKHNSRIAIVGTLLLILSISVVNTSCTNIAPFFTDTVPSFFKGLVSELASSGETQHTINVGTEVDLATQTVDQSGGVVSIDKPGDPLDGLEIEVPAGSYGKPKSFKVSYAPVTGHDFGDNFNPASPLIKIDNDGGYSDEIMMVTIPTEIPEGKFAMGFFYDDQAGKLEGIPIVEEDATHITIATRHFSNIIISLIDTYLLMGEIDSGFRPGVDDWQFTNYGSYIAPNGHCWGQSLTAMWYYCEKTLKGAPHLYGLYDNNGGTKTPNLQEDDSLGYRLASTVQEDMGYNKVLFKVGKYISKSDDLAYHAFAYAILLTGEPQYVRIRQNAGASIHAMVVYKVAANTLYIADPNYPGSLDRKIELAEGKFKPYNSGDNANAIQQGQGKAYDKIDYLAKTTFIDWEQIGKRWEELEAKTIGNDRFPAYVIRTLDDEGKIIELKDGHHVKDKELALDVIDANNNGLPRQVYRDGNILERNDSRKYELEPGNNQLGIVIYGKVNGEDKYIDFKYVNVVYETEEVKPPEHGNHPVVESISGPGGPIMGPGPYEYTIAISGGTPPYFVEWRGNNVIYSGGGYETVSILRDQLRDNGEGYWVFITVKDSADKYAQWVNEDGVTKQEFTYGALNNGVVVTEPGAFPYDMPGD